jgi:hypothetical protein
MWTANEYNKYRQEAIDIANADSPVLDRGYLRACARDLIESLRSNLVRFRVYRAGEAVLNIQDEFGTALVISSAGDSVSAAVSSEGVPIFSRTLQKQKWLAPGNFLELSVFFDRLSHVFRAANETQRWIAEAERVASSL